VNDTGSWEPLVQNCQHVCHFQNGCQNTT
jgi:hypothetical protein